MISFQEECSRLHALEDFIGPFAAPALRDFIELQANVDSHMVSNWDVESDLVEFDREIDFPDDY